MIHHPLSVAADLHRRDHPLFVIGMWRSGTSLLWALLNQHTEIKLLYESELPLLRSLFWSPARKSWALRLDFWNAALRRHRIDPERLPRAADLPLAFRSMALQYASSRGASIWGCKSPNYYACVPSLAREFPHASYIFMWRDPTQICASILRAASNSLWFRRRGMWRRVLLGCEMLKRSCDTLRSRGARVHELYYCDLVEHPEPELRKICDFLGIPFLPAMTSLAGADLSAVYDDDHHELLRNGTTIRRTSINSAREAGPQRLKQKINRYQALWRQEFNGWRLASAPQPSAPPGWLERGIDRLLFRLLVTIDGSRCWIFAFAPLFSWRMYRRLKYEDVDRFISSPAMREAMFGGGDHSAGTP
jgi:hypothetical protein